MDQEIIQAIREDLRVAADKERVHILWAIESGSRAWGFPSPDSDYDCRFVYVRSKADYLALFPKRDVIELPMDKIFDVNGWDLQKAIRLALKGNAVIVEWLQSPFVYSGNSDFKNEFLSLCRDVVDRNSIAMHYLHISYSISKQFVDLEGQVHLKKLFYLIRPVFALLWLQQNPKEVIAPMNIHELMQDISLERGVALEIEDLLARKAVTREIGAGIASDRLISFCQKEISKAEHAFSKPVMPTQERKDKAEAFFLRMVDRFAPG